MAFELRDEPDLGRFELRDDGELVGIASYHLEGDSVVVPHTEIVASRRGQGLGAVLVGAVLDDVRAHGRRVRPLCWYVRQFVSEHPEYADVIEP